MRTIKHQKVNWNHVRKKTQIKLGKWHGARSEVAAQFTCMKFCMDLSSYFSHLSYDLYKLPDIFNIHSYLQGKRMSNIYLQCIEHYRHSASSTFFFFCRSRGWEDLGSNSDFSNVCQPDWFWPDSQDSIVFIIRTLEPESLGSNTCCTILLLQVLNLSPQFQLYKIK